jgi:acyl carrier protein
MTVKPSKGPVTFEEFKRMLVDILQVDEEKVVPEASFVSDLMVDSIKLVELMLGLEENGINIPIEAAWDVQTVGDAYRVYKESMPGGDQQLATSG